MATKKAVATVGNDLPMERPSWMGDSNRGNEGVSADDMTIPRISIIQDLSPQHKKSKPEYIEGAEPKMMFNTATGELYGNDVMVVPVLFRKEWVIWKSLDVGGGFMGAYHSADEANEALSALEDAEDCEVVDTAQHFVLIFDPASPVDNPHVEQAVISMSKSQMKVSRKWNTMITANGGDRWERVYKLEVVDDKNKQGQEYYNFKVSQLGFVTEALFKTAEKMYDAVRTGAMDVKRDPEGTAPAEPQEDDDNDEF